MKWKYKVASYHYEDGWETPGMGHMSLVEGLDSLGADEWELVSASYNCNDERPQTEFVFKRADK